MEKNHSGLHQAAFKESELVKVPEPKQPVVLVSGGPVMDLVALEGENGVCEWEDNDNEQHRRLFPLVCLYGCKRVIEQED